MSDKEIPKRKRNDAATLYGGRVPQSQCFYIEFPPGCNTSRLFRMEKSDLLKHLEVEGLKYNDCPRSDTYHYIESSTMRLNFKDIEGGIEIETLTERLNNKVPDEIVVCNFKGFKVKEGEAIHRVIEEIRDRTIKEREEAARKKREEKLQKKFDKIKELLGGE